jgi:N-methylhydantoinase B/oxoprolinase/acetone carboxylase alpha subunit
VGTGKVRYMSNVERGLIALLLIVVAVVGSHIWGWHRGYAASEVVWTEQKKALIANAESRAAELRAEGARLAADLHVARANVRIEYVEVIREVHKVASATRRSINADLAGLLNSLSGIRETTERIGADGTVEARREVATDSPRPEGTSERALGEWIAGAVKSHEECRQQANSLIEYAKACSR